MTITDPEEFKQRYPTAISVVFEGEKFRSIRELSKHLAKEYEARPETIRNWLDRGADRTLLDEHFQRRAAVTATPAPPPPASAAVEGMSPWRALFNARTEQNRAQRAVETTITKTAVAPSASTKKPRSGAMPVTYKGSSFPSRTSFTTHLAAQLGAPVATVSTVLYAHGWNIDAALADMRLAAQGEAHHGGNGAAVTGTPGFFDRVVLEQLLVEDVPEPIASELAEIGEKIGVIRGAYEAREAVLIDLQKRLDAAHDPAINRKLADVETQLAHQTASLKRLESQLVSGHKSRERIGETINLLNRKITQLMHDLKLEKVPTPTRRDPAAG
jgi:uncharacterized coiled-coil protein SlyX